METLGDAVYMVAGGVPDRCPDHASNVAGVALDLIQGMKTVKWPGNQEMHLRIG